MPLDVLQPVERRRRRRRPVLLLILALVAVSVGAALAAWRFWPSGSEPAAAAQRPAVASGASSPVLEPLLAVRRPLERLRLRRPVAARSAILVDGATGTVIWARRPHERRPVASTTKIMTAVLALERLRRHDLVTIDPSVTRVAPLREGLRAGERVPAEKLLYGLMLYSGNDSALALAIAAAGSRPAFVRLMNEKARELGLRDSHFSTPSGVVDRDNRSSAWDLAALARYAMRSPTFRTIVATRVKRVTWPPPTYAKVYVNKNRLIGGYPGADGVKTGWTTRAGHTLVASAHRYGIRLIVVVLRSPDPFGDARRLLDFGFDTRG